MVRKVIKSGVKKIGRGLRPGKAKIDPVKDLKAAKAKTTRAKKPKTVKRSEAPIQSERSKIAKANAAAKTRRAKAAAKTGGVGALAKTITSRTARARNKTNKVLPVGSKRAIGTAGVASAAAIGTLNKKKPAAKKETFADAFRKARAKGEGTKFTHNGKKYVAVTKTDLKKKGYDNNELAAYNKRGGKARGPLNRLGQKAKKVLLGKDKKFGGDKGAIDFIRKPVKKAAGGMMSPQPLSAMTPRKRPPSTKPLPRPKPRPKPRPIPRPPKTMVRTEAIDPRLPRGKAGKGPAEPTDSRTQVISQPPKKKLKFKERFRREPVKMQDNFGGQPPQPKGPRKLPGAKDGGMMKTTGYKSGGSVKTKACGAAKRGYGKAYMKGKR